MEFDNAKENIQPLACGRDASILHASITHTSKELHEERLGHEATIHAYNGDDPLEPWFSYVSWIEQMFPSGGKESGLTQVLSKCLRRFESEERYYQDRRMIKLFIKFIYNNKDPLECFQQLYNGGIGTMVADFYVAWAYCYDSIGQMKKADETFRRGIECRAMPLDELKESYHHYKMAVGERILYKDDDGALESTKKQLEERRLALSSLRGFGGKKKNEIGSIRTGAAIKSYKPGVVKTNQPDSAARTSTNAAVAVLKDENIDPNAMPVIETAMAGAATVGADEKNSSAVIRSIVDTVRHQENEHEPGPWNKVNDKKNSKKLLLQKQAAVVMSFSIHEDVDIEIDGQEKKTSDMCTANKPLILTDAEKHYDKPFKYPENFVCRNRPQAEWVLPVTTEVEPDANTLPCYNKSFLYPRPNREFSMEELYAYRLYKKRSIENAFTMRYDPVWGVNNINTPFRMYPNFARRSNPQKLNELDIFQALPHVEGMFAPTTQLYDEQENEEFQLEELMAREWLNSKHKTVLEPQDMDETNCASSCNEQVQRRKSFFPKRRSMAIRKIVGEGLDSKQPNHTLAEEPSISVCFKAEKEAVIPKKEDHVMPCLAKASIKQKDHQTSPEEKEVEKAAFAPVVQQNTDVKPKLENVVTTLDDADSFKFKLPAPPAKPTYTAAPTSTVSNKLPFEIFVEDSATAAESPIPPVGAFDAEETCSTQMFNICLKSQAASTPKLEQKVQKRQFNVLREVEQPQLHMKTSTTPPNNDVASPTAGASISTSPSTSENALSAPIYSLSPQSPDGDAASANLPANSFSPGLRKQLSTILETSEHGTHSTAATTKSSNGTQMSEITEATGAVCQTQIEIQDNFPVTQEPITLMHEQQQEHAKSSSVAVSNVLEKSPQTTAHSSFSQMRNKSPNALAMEPFTDVSHKETRPSEKARNLNFSIFEDPTQTVPKIMSENISPKNPVAGNFPRLLQNDELLPIENIAVQPLRFQEDKTETVTKLLGMRYVPEDKTENLTNNLLTNAKLHTMETPNQNGIIFCDGDYDTHEFFSKSPLKFPTLASKERSNLQLTPLNAAPTKRLCVHETPNDFKTTTRSTSAASSPEGNSKAKNKNLLETFMNDFSLTTNSLTNSNKLQPLPPTTTTTQFGGRFHDSFVPEFSFIEETQPTKGALKSKPAAELQTDVSMIEETQPQTVQAAVDESLIIVETQEAPPIINHAAAQSKGAIPKILQPNKSKLHESSSKDHHHSQRKHTERESLLERTKFNRTKNQTEKLMIEDSFFMVTSPLKVTTEPVAASVTSTMDELLVKLNKTKILDTTQKNEEQQSLKPSNHSVRESLIPRYVSSGKKSQQPSQSLLTPIKPRQTDQWPQTGAGNNLCIFDLNNEGDTFASGINLVKNSTMLPNRQSIMQEPSLHIKHEPLSINTIIAAGSQSTVSNSHLTASDSCQRLNVDEADDGVSIYYKKTPCSPKPSEHVDSWSKDHCAEEFIHEAVDLNETALVIETKCMSSTVNPFDQNLISAFLDNVDFVSFLKHEPNTELVGKVQCLRQNMLLKINNTPFKVTKFIGQGNYGSVYCGINTETQKKYVFKQERPANYWEYYICLEVQARIKNDDLLLSYMQIEHARIGNNASIFVSAFAPHGSIINVCNKVKKKTAKNIDEYVVMHLTCELLEIIDHLHAAQIIHADLKADNILFMRKLAYNSKQTALHLIDFGVSIDMRQFPSTAQTFSYVHHEETFKCIEMREQRPWTYQLDLYGVAGVIHILLFGKYMEVEKKNIWLPKQHMPRYINKILWEHIFRTLLNIRDCRSMPNLQELRQMLKQEMVEKERFVITKIAEFNKALGA